MCDYVAVDDSCCYLMYWRATPASHVHLSCRRHTAGVFIAMVTIKGPRPANGLRCAAQNAEQRG